METTLSGTGSCCKNNWRNNQGKLDILRDADYIFRDEIAKAGLDREISQYFAVLTDMRSVGVKDGERTYDYTLALRAVKPEIS